jgi:hypothetical protein
VVGRLRFQVARHLIKNFAAVDIFALAVPIDEAKPALTDELRQPGLQRHMQIGDMGENEHFYAAAGESVSSGAPSQTPHKKSRTADQDADGEDQNAADHDLERGL